MFVKSLNLSKITAAFESILIAPSEREKMNFHLFLANCPLKRYNCCVLVSEFCFFWFFFSFSFFLIIVWSLSVQRIGVFSFQVAARFALSLHTFFFIHEKMIYYIYGVNRYIFLPTFSVVSNDSFFFTLFGEWFYFFIHSKRAQNWSRQVASAFESGFFPLSLSFSIWFCVHLPYLMIIDF